MMVMMMIEVMMMVMMMYTIIIPHDVIYRSVEVKNGTNLSR
jgi:hypothetical protein